MGDLLISFPCSHEIKTGGQWKPSGATAWINLTITKGGRLRLTGYVGNGPMAERIAIPQYPLKVLLTHREKIRRINENGNQRKKMIIKKKLIEWLSKCTDLKS